MWWVVPARRKPVRAASRWRWAVTWSGLSETGCESRRDSPTWKIARYSPARPNVRCIVALSSKETPRAASAHLSVCVARSMTASQASRISREGAKVFFVPLRPGVSHHRLPRRAFGVGQQQVAVAESRQRVEQRVLGLNVGLHLFGLAEQGQRVVVAARLVQGVGQRRPFAHPLELIPAAVGEGHGLLGVVYRPARLAQQLAQRQLQLAQVAGTPGGFCPAFLCHAHLQPRPHRLQRLGQPTHGAKVEGGMVQQPGLVGFRERGRDATPRRLEETGHGPQVGTERPELVRAVEPVPSRSAQDAIAVHLLASLLLPAGLAAVGHGLVQRLKVFQRRLRPVRSRLAQVFVQTPVRRAEG